MISFIFKTNKSDNNHLNKIFSDEVTYDGVVKEDCSVEQPVLIIKSSPSIMLHNYVVIPDFGRSYFIKDWVIMENGYYMIYCEIDVLETYKNVILNNPCIIEASENDSYSDYLPHDSFVSTVKAKTDIMQFPSGLNNNGEFILITAGG